MASLLAKHILARDDNFVQRVMIALVDAAVDVSFEISSGDHRVDQLRESLARQVVNEPAKYAHLFAYAVVTRPTITTDSSDADLKRAVQLVWNAFAGLNPSAAKPGTSSASPNIKALEEEGSSPNLISRLLGRA